MKYENKRDQETMINRPAKTLTNLKKMNIKKLIFDKNLNELFLILDNCQVVFFSTSKFGSQNVNTFLIPTIRRDWDFFSAKSRTKLRFFQCQQSNEIEISSLSIIRRNRDFFTVNSRMESRFHHCQQSHRIKIASNSQT